MSSPQRARVKRTTYPKPAYLIVLEYLKSIRRPASPSEIARATGVNYNTVRGTLQKLRQQGLIEYTNRGWQYVEDKRAE